jgi:hypothetical protein
VKSANSEFIKCEKCGKTLIERIPTGELVFKFGGFKRQGGPPVEMAIRGIVNLKCLRFGCDHINKIASK